MQASGAALDTNRSRSAEFKSASMGERAGRMSAMRSVGLPGKRTAVTSSPSATR
jgi:hypothetical protein